MTSEQEQQERVDFWKVLQIASPLVSVIVFIVYMQASLQQTIRDVEELKQFNNNIGQILTAHTTQLAVNQNDIAGNKRNDLKIENTLVRLENKVDQLLTHR